MTVCHSSAFLVFLALGAVSLPAQPKLLKNIGMLSSGRYAVIGKIVYFTALDGRNGYRLWRSNGSSAGTYVVKTGITGPTHMLVVGKTLYFPSRDAKHGVELWKSDGTPQGTVLVKDLNPGTGNGATSVYAHMKGFVYFTGSDASGNSGLWRTDGTAAGTTFVKKMLWQFTRQMVEFKGHLYFAAGTTQNGYELWRSDGTPAGTGMWREFIRGRTNGFVPSVNDFTVLNGHIYFSPFVTRQRHLWRTDGTLTGTVSVEKPGRLSAWGKVGNKLIISMAASSQTSLYASDGTPNKATKISSVITVRAATDIGGGRGLFFGRAKQLKDPFGDELWITDGTTAGTHLVKDIYPGRFPSWSGGEAPTRIGDGGLVVFSARDGKTGFEPWVSDGTPKNTVRVADIAKGKLGSSPVRFATSSDNVFFMASDRVNTASAPWVASLNFLGGTLIEQYGTGCPGTNGVPVLAGKGAPKIGNTTFGLELTKARASAITVIALSAKNTNLAIGGGCRLLVSLFPADAPLLEAKITDTKGVLQLPLAIPNALGLIGVNVYWQAWVIDPKGAFQSQFASSNGLRTLIGY
jgi:ELWxxDGT repeat protein